jgi:predicted nucleic-acid-binding protein
MLGDASTLVAALVSDREEQHRSAVATARIHGRLEIGEAVLGESCWVLERTYGLPRREVAMIVREMLGSRDFVAWDPELADRALARMHSSPRFSFVDCLLIERALSGEQVLTFDRDLARAIEQS